MRHVAQPQVFQNAASNLKFELQQFSDWTGPRDTKTGFPTPTYGTKRHAAENHSGHRASGVAEQSLPDQDAFQEHGESFEVVLPQTDSLDFHIIGIAFLRY